MVLYHFTAAQHLASILDAQCLTLTESNIGSGRPDWPPYGEHVGPDVVWLTSSRSPKRQGLNDPKTVIRFTVEPAADAVHRWLDWSRQYGINAQWAAVLESGMNAASWWVSEQPIDGCDWLAVEQLETVRSRRATSQVWRPVAERSRSGVR